MPPRLPAPGRVPRWVPLLAVLVAGGYLAAEAWLLDGRLGFPLDDSFIHLQFARSLAAGHGLAYNPGEIVTGSTAPLWTALLALLFPLPGSVVLWIKLAGIAAFVALGAATWWLGRELDLPPVLAGLAAALVLCTYWLAWAALSGMEVNLFTALSLAGMALHVRERREPDRAPLSLAVLGVAILLRPEGMLLLVLAVVDRCLRLRRDGDGLRLERPDLRRLLLGLAAAALAVLPTLAFYWAHGGSPLPTTFGAKAGEMRRLAPDLQYVYLVVGILFRPQPWMTLLAGAGGLALIARLGGERDRGLLPLLWTAALPVAYSMLAPQGKHLLVGNFGRYYFPLFPPVVLLGCLGLEEVAERLAAGLRVGARRLPVRGLLFALLILPTFATLVGGALFYAGNVANVADGDVRMAAWLERHVPPEAVIAVQDIGAMKFFLPNRVVDLAGIVTPEIQRYIREAITPEDRFGQAGMLRFLHDRRPDYLVAFPAWYPAVVRDEGWREVYRLHVPDNITLAGDDLVVYATPWTRFPLRPDTEASPR